MYGEKGLPDHSKAKLDLYREYLVVYLRVIAKAKFTKTIFLFDLFCGQGQYEGDPGSPLVLYDALQGFCRTNTEDINLRLLFNDEDRRNIEKVITLFSERPALPHCTIDFRCSDFRVLLPEVFAILSGLKNDKCLIFLDPFGYKDICFEDIARLLESGKTEIIWFIPISFIFRFASHALESTDPSQLPLQSFLLDFFGGAIPSFSDQRDVISKLLQQFKDSFPKHLIDTFTIERDAKNVFCLFYFTNHIRGFEKMLEAKWVVDERDGRGHRFDSATGDLFPTFELSNFPEKLEAYIISNAGCTNKDIYEFSLHNGYLPKHAYEALKKLSERVDLQLNCDTKLKKGSFYLNYDCHSKGSPKVVKFKIVHG